MAEEKRGMPDTIRFPLVLGVICLIAGGMLGWVYALTKPGIEKGRVRKTEEAFKSLVAGYSSFERGVVEGTEVYRVKGKDGATIAYAAATVGKGSYNKMQPIRLITVMDEKAERILGVYVADCHETPGLGDRVNASDAAFSLAGKVAGEPERKLIRLASGKRAVEKVIEATDEGVRVRKEDGTEEMLAGATVLEEKLPARFQMQFDGLTAEEARLKKDGGLVDGITGATVSSTAAAKAVQEGVEKIRKFAGESR